MVRTRDIEPIELMVYAVCFTDTVYACSALMRKRIAIPDNENILLRPSPA